MSQRLLILVKVLLDVGFSMVVAIVQSGLVLAFLVLPVALRSVRSIVLMLGSGFS